MKPLKAAATTSQPVLTSQQVETIFFKVPELYEIHKDFYDGLLPRVQQWGHQQRVGDLFQKLVRNLGPRGGDGREHGGPGLSLSLAPTHRQGCGGEGESRRISPPRTPRAGRGSGCCAAPCWTPTRGRRARLFPHGPPLVRRWCFPAPPEFCSGSRRGPLWTTKRRLTGQQD